ncbi:MAG: DUF1674 domain-containing protein [Xanthomonadaceae bacterium]|nr:DUF1674 domain-containing protein [Xanthomonadaceae bacterium]MDE1958969.1 DUF1674 domain-containing protein [Xanthomonadaceae bacterium]MDE2178684.1 DUF1674 domain-containing protein [Xanthomonadaceae bacterium]MDE2246916.1 DUF1674 domain-containing protein [Xanthomonadaceae bacterium]
MTAAATPMPETTPKLASPAHPDHAASAAVVPEAAPAPVQRPPPDPTRYGDWEKHGRCIDF